MRKEEQIMKKFSRYTDGVRMIMLTQRGKEGGKVDKPDRVAKRRISMNDKEFREILKDFLELKKSSKAELRIYSCVNRRDFDKGIREFKRQQLEADYYDRDSKNRFYLDLKNRFLGSLMKPNSRAETEFLIDIDEDDDEKVIRDKLEKLGVLILLVYETKNGRHIVTKPFNPNDLPEAEIKKDALLLLDY